MNKTNEQRSAIVQSPRKQASNKARCARRGVNSRSTRRARPRVTEPTPRAPVPSRSLEEAGAEILRKFAMNPPASWKVRHIFFAAVYFGQFSSSL
jgi:hypothetical protein